MVRQGLSIGNWQDNISMLVLLLMPTTIKRNLIKYYLKSL